MLKTNDFTLFVCFPQYDSIGNIIIYNVTNQTLQNYLEAVKAERKAEEMDELKLNVVARKEGFMLIEEDEPSVIIFALQDAAQKSESELTAIFNLFIPRPEGVEEDTFNIDSANYLRDQLRTEEQFLEMMERNYGKS